MLFSKLGPLGFDPYPFALMLLIVGGIFQALAMVANYGRSERPGSCE